MFTNWTSTDPKYFYLRGIIYGVVLATMFWKVAVPFLSQKWADNKKGSKGNERN